MEGQSPLYVDMSHGTTCDDKPAHQIASAKTPIGKRNTGVPKKGPHLQLATANAASIAITKMHFDIREAQGLQVESAHSTMSLGFRAFRSVALFVSWY